MNKIFNLLNKTKDTHPIIRIVCSAMLVFVFFFAWFNAFFPALAVNVFGFKLYIVSYTGSMQPVLSYTDLIVVQKYSFNSVQEGDIITFLARLDSGEEIYVTHQVVEVLVNEDTGERVYRTQGINSNKPDGNPVSVHGKNDTFLYIGKYVFTLPVIGAIITFLGTPFGFMGLLTNALGVLAIYVILKHAPPREDK